MVSGQTAIDLLVRKDALAQTQFAHPALAEPGPGEALIKVDTFAFTANNVTYGVAGEQLSYWALFPAPEGWGRIPVWGFADVIASRAPGLEVGERLYGYLPMSTHLTIKPDRLSPTHFYDAAPTRGGPHQVYHQYMRCAADPGYDPALEAEQAIFRPLYTTSFILDDYCADHGFFGAKTIILASASSKTAIGTAFLLSRRAGRDYRVVGLTSPRNRAFVESLGVYDTVAVYDDIDGLPVDGPAAFIDMSGSASVIGGVHRRFGDALVESCIVGITHYEERGDTRGLPGAKPTMFFAPNHIQKRHQDWGAAGFQTRLKEAWTAFIGPGTSWLRVVDSKGPEAALAAYRRVLSGEALPEEGHMLSLWDE